MKTKLLLFILLSLPYLSQAQYEFHRYEDVPVSLNGNALSNAWAGGLNSPQFSKIDLNGDGLEDIFVFDRIGNRILTFVNENGTAGAMEYNHEFDYVAMFPDSLKNWVLLRDMNCDGKKDICSSRSSSIMVHTNNGGGELSFDLAVDKLFASYNLSGTPFDAPTYCVSVDIPSIVDYDNDGDMDIFSWTETGGTIYYYKNISSETGNCEDLTFKTVNRCYAKIEEASESFTMFLGDDFDCGFNVVDPEFNGEDTRHTGGMLLSIDLDQNGILDLVVSDVTETYMIALLLEEGTDGLDEAVELHLDFPATFGGSDQVDMRVFPGGFYEDVNNDGVKDLLACPNGTVDTEDNESVWFYLNNGSDDLPNFQLQQQDWLQETMIDFGRHAYPVPVDYNGDGLMDLVVSNKEYNQSVDQHYSQLALFVNTGTATEPAFDIVDLNWLNLPQYSVESVFPAFGDLDNDGDMDMVLGEEGGILHYFENSAGAGNPMDLSLAIAAMSYEDNSDIDVGQFAAPVLFDINNDGTLDLLVGERNGNVNYIRNNGTAESFSFVLEQDTIGDALATNFLGIFGNAVPFFWRDEADEIHMLLGTETGNIMHFDNISGNLEGTFNLVTENFADIWEGTYSGACMYDFTGDDTLDIVYGQVGGGLAFYRGGDLIINTPEINELANLNIFPNPASDLVYVSGIQALDAGSWLRVRDMLGREVVAQKCTSTPNCPIDVSALKSGWYLVELRNAKGAVIGTGKFAKH
ncbi:MAG: T9SS type A sorting domain-containing protein [Flavobacteriales bacterium]|nr:T9SS type A sorting domain-containing protein [Flavobacteriales bacterium]